MWSNKHAIWHEVNMLLRYFYITGEIFAHMSLRNKAYFNRVKKGRSCNHPQALNSCTIPKTGFKSIHAEVTSIKMLLKVSRKKYSLSGGQKLRIKVSQSLNTLISTSSLNSTSRRVKILYRIIHLLCLLCLRNTSFLHWISNIFSFLFQILSGIKTISLAHSPYLIRSKTHLLPCPY